MNFITSVVVQFGNRMMPWIYWGDWQKKEIVYKLNETTKAFLRVGTWDKFVAWEVWKFKEYGDLDLGEDDVVIDIGGHIGMFTLFAASKMKLGKVFTFEPWPENYKMIERNLKLNNIHNVILSRQAVAGKKGKAVLHVEKDVNGMNSFYGFGSGKRKMVDTTMLEDVINKYNLRKVEFLKIDAEGAEYDILLNCDDAVLAKIEKIVLEYHDYLNPSFDYRKLINRLSKAGFMVRYGSSILQRIFMKSGILMASRQT